MDLVVTNFWQASEGLLCYVFGHKFLVKTYFEQVV